MKKLMLIVLLLGSVSSFSQTGINTDLPKAVLDVEGDLRVSKLEKYNSSSMPVYWNPDTQKLAVGSVSEENSEEPKPFYTLSYKINTARGEDWISNFNTRISSKTYTLIVTSAQFRRTNDTGVYVKYNGSKANTNDNATAIFNYGAFISDGTWRIKADYASAAPGFNTSDFYWEISVLIINNNMIYQLRERRGSVSSSGGGSDTSSPI